MKPSDEELELGWMDGWMVHLDFGRMQFTWTRFFKAAFFFFFFFFCATNVDTTHFKIDFVCLPFRNPTYPNAKPGYSYEGIYIYGYLQLRSLQEIWCEIITYIEWLI
jgi:hypothetical protein